MAVSPACTARWIGVSIVAAILLMILTLVSSIFGNIFVATQSTTSRFCITALPGNVIGAAGEVGARVTGMITMDINPNKIFFELQTSLTMSGITAVTIRGPTQLATPGVGPLATALCGAPGLACDTTTNPGTVTGTAVHVYDGNPINTDLNPLILAIRAQPYLYYFEILTNAKPSSPGSCRQDIIGMCGYK
jgi:hypothetical protein